MDVLWHCSTHIISIDGDSEIWHAEVLLGMRHSHSFQNVIFHAILTIPTLKFSVIFPILQRDVSQIWAPKVIMKGFPSFSPLFPMFFHISIGGPRLDATYDTEKKMPEASLRRMQMETATKIAEKLPLKAGWCRPVLFY